ncbi:hypothetical protein [Nitrosococcus halophilus]|uniref:hypothetical protein n=1 Tax=Nitrosococcus halophilus TaxID=133539 RepID=UPI0002FD0EA3|nr:hypothetical protein [Nitrosococcus halophilus]
MWLIYLDNTLSVVELITGKLKKNINLLADYDPVSGEFSDNDGNEKIALGGLPIQTPVSPDGEYVVTANTLTATITIVDTETDTMSLSTWGACFRLRRSAV